MKKIFLSVLALAFFAGCQDLTEFNKDPKNPSEVEAGSLVANATVELFDFMTSTNVNVNNFRLWAQQWTETTYTDEANYDIVTRNVNGRTWNTLYSTVLRDLREAAALIEADDKIIADNKANQLAQIEVMQVYAYQVLVDIFGDIPYSAAFGDDVTPAYDNDADIYSSLITRLDAAIAGFRGTTTGLGSSDLVYGGDVALWKKFANSLKLKIAIRIAEVDAARARSLAEAAVAAGVFESNDDNFVLHYLEATPNTNPLWVDLIQSNRNDFVAANTIVDYMHDLADPRLPEYFQDPKEVIQGTDTLLRYVGGVYGANSPYSLYSKVGVKLVDPTFPGLLMDYAEVAFLKADAAARGFSVGGTVEAFYEEGIRASMDYWGVSAAAADAYLASPKVAYATASGDWKQKIAMQKWLALYNQGFEAYTTYRFYNAPAMNIAATAGTLPPARYTYPVTEYSLNGESVQAAAAAIGGDLLTTQIFWDVN
jgi:hypothetical protein